MKITASILLCFFITIFYTTNIFCDTLKESSDIPQKTTTFNRNVLTESIGGLIGPFIVGYEITYAILKKEVPETEKTPAVFLIVPISFPVTIFSAGLYPLSVPYGVYHYAKKNKKDMSYLSPLFGSLIAMKLYFDNTDDISGHTFTAYMSSIIGSVIGSYIIPIQGGKTFEMQKSLTIGFRYGISRYDRGEYLDYIKETIGIILEKKLNDKWNCEFEIGDNIKIGEETLLSAIFKYDPADDTYVGIGLNIYRQSIYPVVVIGKNIEKHFDFQMKISMMYDDSINSNINIYTAHLGIVRF